MTNEASSLARNSASAATSPGLPSRLTGCVAANLALASSEVPVNRSTIGVQMTPGQIAFTRMPCVA